MKKTVLFFYLVAFMASIACGCSGIKWVDSVSLESSKWQLDSLSGSKITVPSGSEITLVFDKDNSKINGFGGCNTYFGSYIVDDDKLNISNIGSTKRTCPEQQTETGYFSTLPKVDKYKIKDKTLYLYSFGSIVIVMQKK